MISIFFVILKMLKLFMLFKKYVIYQVSMNINYKIFFLCQYYILDKVFY